jgi:hypothetical protein
MTEKRPPLPPTVISVRLNAKEHTTLYELAEGIPLSTFLKDAVLKQGQQPPSSRNPSMVDRKLQGQILAKLGELEASSILADLSQATASSSLPEIQSISEAADDACDALFWIRDQMVAAQGLKPHCGRGTLQ